MEQFLLNFHHFPLPEGVKLSAEEFVAVNQQWQNYIGSIAGKGLFVGTQRLDQAGSIIHPDGSITNAVNEGKGLIVGTLTLKANSLFVIVWRKENFGKNT
jgi:hypothetical protein